MNGEVLYDYDLDDTNNALIDVAANGVAQNAYQTLKHAGTFDNKDNLGADRFTDVDGVNNTVDIGNTTAFFETNKYVLNYTDEASGDTTHTFAERGSWDNTENAFDGDDETYAEIEDDNLFSDSSIDNALGKTFSERFIHIIKYDVSTLGGGSLTGDVELQIYDGTSWTTVTTIGQIPGSGTSSYSGEFVLDSNAQGIRILFDHPDSTNNRTLNNKVFILEYGDCDSSSTLLYNQNLPSLTGNEKSICVYADEVNTTNTNITYNVSDGTTTISDLELNTVNGIASLGSGQLEITFNLSTTDTGETPELYGYSYYIN